MVNFLSLLVIAGAFLLASCDKCCDHTKDTHAHEKQEKSGIKIITSEHEFEQLVLKSDKPVVVDFTAKWCGACQVMKPVFEELATELGNKYTFVSLDVDKAEAVANNHEIQGIPAFLLFKNGIEVNKNNRMVGVVSKEDFKNTIEQSFK